MISFQYARDILLEVFRGMLAYAREISALHNPKTILFEHGRDLIGACMHLSAGNRLACISNSSTALSTASSLCSKHRHVINRLGEQRTHDGGARVDQSHRHGRTKRPTVMSNVSMLSLTASSKLSCSTQAAPILLHTVKYLTACHATSICWYQKHAETQLIYLRHPLPCHHGARR